MIEHRIFARAPADVVFAIYQDVSRWHTWDPDTQSAAIHGAFAVGTRGRLAPSKGRPIRIEITELTPDRSFTVTGGVPGFQMVFEHKLHPQGAGTDIVHRVQFKGPLSFLLKPLLSQRINKGLPLTLERLRQLAEQKAKL